MSGCLQVCSGCSVWLLEGLQKVCVWLLAGGCGEAYSSTKDYTEVHQTGGRYTVLESEHVRSVKSHTNRCVHVYGLTCLACICSTGMLVKKHITSSPGSKSVGQFLCLMGPAKLPSCHRTIGACQLTPSLTSQHFTMQAQRQLCMAADRH